MSIRNITSQPNHLQYTSCARRCALAVLVVSKSSVSKPPRLNLCSIKPILRLISLRRKKMWSQFTSNEWTESSFWITATSHSLSTAMVGALDLTGGFLGRVTPTHSRFLIPISLLSSPISSKSDTLRPVNWSTSWREKTFACCIPQQERWILKI